MASQQSGSSANARRQQHRHSMSPQSSSRKKNDARSRHASFNAYGAMNSMPATFPSHDQLHQMLMQSASFMGQQPGAAATQPHPTFMPWPAYNPPITQTSMLADAYGAAHGQPQPGGTTNLDWVNGMSAYMLMDPGARSAPLPFNMVQHPHTNMAMYQQPCAQLTHYMNHLQLQSQEQQDKIALQQNLLPSIQPAQEQRLPVEHQAKLNMDESSSSMAFERQQADAMRTCDTGSVHKNFGARPTTTHLNRQSADLGPGPSSRVYSAFDFTSPSKPRVRANDATSPKGSPNNTRSIQNSSEESFAFSSIDQSARYEPKRKSALHPSDEQTSDTSFENRQSVTPSIIIDQVNITPTDDTLTRKAHSVGMRMGPRTATIVHEVQVPVDNAVAGSISADLSSRRSLSTDLNRTGNAQGSPSLPLIQPRRQPRGPPTDAFFANNFLARKSLRTRREAMLKLCASPRAPAFQGSRATTTSSPLTKEA